MARVTASRSRQARSASRRRAGFWLAAMVFAGVAAAGAVSEVEFIRVSGDSAAAEVRILSSGRPALVGSQLDQDGVLVLELADHRPAADLVGPRPATGLVAAVDVRLHEAGGEIGLECPVEAISDWELADALAAGAPPPSASSASPLNPCRDLPDGPRDGLVPAVEVVDPATGANTLSRFTPPFVLR